MGIFPSNTGDNGGRRSALETTPAKVNQQEAVSAERLPNRSAIWRYGFAALSVLVAWGATSLLRIEAPQQPLSLVFFFAAVAISAGLGGLGPGVFATALSALLCDFFFLEPLHTLFVSKGDLPLFLLFLFVALLINIPSERLQAETKAVEQRFHDRVQGLDAIVWSANPQTLQFTF